MSDPKPYEPELGQVLFGQPWQDIEAPALLIAALTEIDRELDRVRGNIHQRRVPSPFGNTSEQFDCETFSAHAYSWGNEEQPWNFRWRDVRVSWYKWYGRGTSVNREVPPAEIATMLDECLAAIRGMES